MTDKIFIGREAQTGDFVMRMPEAAVPALYEMLQSAPSSPPSPHRPISPPTADSRHRRLHRRQQTPSRRSSRRRMAISRARTIYHFNIYSV